MVERIEICKNCKYFAERREGDPLYSLFTCHRYPPTVLANAHSYPNVDEDEWCGEWKTKE